MLALPIFPGRLSIVPPLRNSPVDCRRQKKAPTCVEASVLALPIFPGSHPPSIVGVHELNFCVRDGNRWTLMTINTNFCGWLLTISMSNDLRHLTPWILAHPSVLVKDFLQGTGDPYRIRTDVKGVRGLCLNHLTNGPWCTFTDSNRGPTD